MNPTTGKTKKRGIVTDPMLRDNSWIIDRISIIAEYYIDNETIQAYTKARKPRMHSVASEGWAPYIPPTAENANIPENPLL